MSSALKNLTKNELISRIVAGVFILAAFSILIPALVFQLTTESISLKSDIQGQIEVSENFADPTEILNFITQKKYQEAESAFIKLEVAHPETSLAVIEYFREYFDFSANLEKSTDQANIDKAEFLILNYSTIEKYLLKNKKNPADVFILAAVVPNDVIPRIYEFSNRDIRSTATPKLCASFKRLCKIYEDAIIVALHNGKMTQKDARILCMKENFCYMRSVVRRFGNKNTRINERREITFDIIRLKSEYPDTLTEEGKFKEVSRYLEALQLECEKRNLISWDTMNATDFSALP